VEKLQEISLDHHILVQVNDLREPNGTPRITEEPQRGRKTPVKSQKVVEISKKSEDMYVYICVYIYMIYV